MEKSYHLYLSTYNCVESHALNICNNSELENIASAIANIITASFGSDKKNWWYSETYARDKAEEMVKPFVGLLDDGAKITKRKYPFFDLGFIITNYPMWPDNKGGYEKDFWI